ncbi:DNA polymerase III subunit alpha [Leuconostoc pseudomesenteroides]|uniref:DNA polymerase III subunit alpha n=1 Tax=Leuconostoc pseudomesenteroides TaxID=33968 RepID=UPI0016668B8E|nr:DNA polymerase III subunit alpha [Leuconostoc pseudomesenteroides]WAM39369.1 DNA polymerase III subunit alpha [Leuconostoc pseudomesenteroides]
MYAPLQILSSYSLLKNPNTIEQILQTAKSRGYEAIALTDVNVMYGAVAWYRNAQKYQIKPLFGLTLMVNGLVNTATTFPLVLIAENQTGYQNLMWLSSARMTNDSEMLFSTLTDHLSGINVILPSTSELSQLIGTEYEATDGYWQQLIKLIDSSHLYLGINTQMAAKTQTQLIAFSKQNNAQIIAADDVDYLNSDDDFTSQVLKAIDSNSKLTDIVPMSHQRGTHILQDISAIQSAYAANADLQKAYQANEQLVQKSEVTISFSETALPPFQTPQGLSSSQFLRQTAFDGLKKRLQKRDVSVAQYEKRLSHELDVIDQLGFSDYFLIVWDIVNFASNNHIQTGPGRGSAAGSLVAYSLRITDVDPIQFNLLFERFLNKERVQMPDIDIDWPPSQREAIFEYLHQKYGKRNFGQIITFGTLAAKQALRDVGRVFGLPVATLSKLSGGIPEGKNGRKVSIESALKEPKLLATIQTIDHGDLLLKTARQIEGLPKNYSTHAAGVVLSARPLVNTLPVQAGTEGRLLTQFEKDTVEQLGLLKIDILGLQNLTILSQALYHARQQLPQNFDISQISLDDEQTIALFAKGDTNGVFQFESSGIKHVLRDLKPVMFEHIVAVNALYRPGPSQNIHQFVARRHGREPVIIPDPSLKTILAPTFGIIVYQEQVMLVAETYAGFTLGEADVLRSAMSKKKLDKMQALHEKFINGAINKGHTQAQAEKIFSYVDEFANYGFNRSHAVAYSKLAFQLAYMKAHYPVAFYTALLNANIGDQRKIQQYVSEAKSRGIVVLAPNINLSQRFWTSNDGQLQMGLNNIRGIRSDFVNAVLDERHQGNFQTIQSFVRRMPEKMRKTETLAQLAYSGALDGFGYNRNELIENSNSLIEGAAFGDLILQETKIKKFPELPLQERLEREKQAIGINLSGHPLDAYRELILNENYNLIGDITVPDKAVRFLGIVDKIRQIRTKKGDDMAFATISDLTGAISVTIFPNLFKNIQNILSVGTVLQITGKSELDSRGELAIVANQIQTITKPQSKGTWFLQFDVEHDTPDNREKLVKVLAKHHGNNPVVIHWQREDKNQQLDESFWMTDETVIILEVAPILGEENVIFRKTR